MFVNFIAYHVTAVCILFLVPEPLLPLAAYLTYLVFLCWHALKHQSINQSMIAAVFILTDPLIVSLAQDVISVIAKNNACIVPLQQRLLPTLISILQSPIDKIPFGLQSVRAFVCSQYLAFLYVVIIYFIDMNKVLRWRPRLGQWHVHWS